MDYNSLVRDCLKLKPAAQKELYTHFAPVMMGVCYRYTKSVTDAEDVMQEGFTRVFQHLSTFKNTGELGGWIRRIMVTTSLNYLKRNKKYRNEMVFTETPLHPVSDENPIIKLDSKQLAEIIRQLPTGYQTIFNLYAIEGYSHVEIADMLGISEGTSKSQYSRARHLLIEWLNTYEQNMKTRQYAGK